MRRGFERRRGVVLIAVLVFIFVLTIIVTQFVGEVVQRLYYRSQTNGNEDLRWIAYQYLTHTQGVLSEFYEFENGFFSPSQGWGDPLSYEPFPVEYVGLSATVTVEDMATKLPLGKLDEESFSVFLESIGLHGFDATRYRDAYFDWIDADDDPRIQGAERLQYEVDLRSKLLPQNGALNDLDEFENIFGFMEWVDPLSRNYYPERMQMLKNLLTVDHKEPINLHVVPYELREFFELQLDFDTEEWESFLMGADKVYGTADDLVMYDGVGDLPDRYNGVLQGIEEGWFALETRICRISIVLERWESNRFYLEVWLKLPGATVESEEAEEDEPQGSEAESNEEIPRTNVDEENPSNEARFEVLVIREKFLEG